jgi:hypothetical protein
MIPTFCMIPAPCQIHFSNDRLNFKQVFWATEGREKGIFAAIPG